MREQEKRAFALTRKAAYTTGIVAQLNAAITIWKKARSFDMMYASEREFVKDFAERTKRNCEAMREGPYEVTQLINSMVGLLVIPRTEIYQEITDKMISADLLNNVKKCVKRNTYKDEDNDLKTIARHIRNGIAHSRMEFCAEKEPQNGRPLQIKTVVFKDEYKNKDKKVEYHFEIEIPIDTLRKFLYAFADAASKIAIKQKGKRIDC